MTTVNPLVQVSRLARQMSHYDASEQARACEGREELSDSAAMTIAAAWQSPGSVGRVLAALASGCAVDLTDLLDDIHATRTQAGHNLTISDARDLDMLATWAIDNQRTED